jgi:HSP20 family protein
MRLVRYTYPDYRTFTPAPAYARWAGLDQALDSLLSGFGSDGARTIPLSAQEDEANLHLTAELPGVAREDVSIDLADDVLNLSATRKLSTAATAPGSNGEQVVSYSRSVTLPYAVQADKVTAELKDGVLRLTLPKAEALKPRKIAVN